MNIFKERLGKDNFNWILLICLIMQFSWIVFCNFALSEQNIDSDSAKIFRHVVELWRKKTLVISDWKYGTTMVIDSAALFAVPLFGILGNIYYAFAVSNAILCILLLWVIFQIFENKGIRCPLICANIIFIPYTVGKLDYFRMMFFNYSGYIMKVLLPLMLIAILVQSEKTGKLKIYQKCFISLYFILLVLSCFSSGLYVFYCGLFPATAGYIALKYYNAEIICMRNMRWILGTFLGVAAGFILNLKWGNASLGDTMSLCSVYDINDNISACIIGIFELLGGVTYENISVFSYVGVRTLVHLCFAVIVIICGIIVGVKTVRHQASMEQTLLLIIFIWNFFVLCVTDTRLGTTTTFHYRYHLVGVVPLLCAAGSVVDGWCKESKEKLCLSAIYLLTLLALILTSYVDVFKMKNDISSSKAMCEYAIENRVKKVYMLDLPGQAEVCRLLDYENAEYLCIYSDIESVFVMDYYKSCEEEPIEFENAVLAVYVGADDFTKDTMNMFGHEYRRIDVVSEFSIYQ